MAGECGEIITGFGASQPWLWKAVIAVNDSDDPLLVEIIAVKVAGADAVPREF